MDNEMKKVMIVSPKDFVSYCVHVQNPRVDPDYNSDCNTIVDEPGALCDKHKFILDFNLERKKNKNKWIVFSGKIKGEEIYIKSYNTWIQLLYIGGVKGVKRSGPMDCSVRDMNKFLEDTL